MYLYIAHVAATESIFMIYRVGRLLVQANWGKVNLRRLGAWMLHRQGSVCCVLRPETFEEPSCNQRNPLLQQLDNI